MEGNTLSFMYSEILRTSVRTGYCFQRINLNEKMCCQLRYMRNTLLWGTNMPVMEAIWSGRHLDLGSVK